MMFDDLVTKNNIDLPKNDIRFIKALIAGDPDSCLYVLQGATISVRFVRYFQRQQPPGETVFI